MHGERTETIATRTQFQPGDEALLCHDGRLWRVTVVHDAVPRADGKLVYDIIHQQRRDQVSEDLLLAADDTTAWPENAHDEADRGQRVVVLGMAAIIIGSVAIALSIAL